jgi:hypothetical protein
MTVKDLKKLVAEIPEAMDEEDVFVKAFSNPCGNCLQLEHIKMDTYGFFGHDIPCVMFDCIEDVDEDEDEDEDEDDNWIDHLKDKHERDE